MVLKRKKKRETSLAGPLLTNKETARQTNIEQAGIMRMRNVEL